MAYADAALMQQILNISQRQWEPHVQHHSQADNFWARFEVAKRRRSGHAKTLRNGLKLLPCTHSAEQDYGVVCAAPNLRLALLVNCPPEITLEREL